MAPQRRPSPSRRGGGHAPEVRSPAPVQPRDEGFRQHQVPLAAHVAVGGFEVRPGDIEQIDQNGAPLAVEGIGVGVLSLPQEGLLLHAGQGLAGPIPGDDAPVLVDDERGVGQELDDVVEPARRRLGLQELGGHLRGDLSEKQAGIAQRVLRLDAVQAFDAGAEVKKTRRVARPQRVLIDVAFRQVIPQQTQAFLAFAQGGFRPPLLFQQPREEERAGDGDRQEGVQQEDRFVGRRPYERARALAGAGHREEGDGGGAGGGAPHAEAEGSP